MSTKISWADESWNPIVGCSKVSAGCVNCYAEKRAYRISCDRRIEHTDTGRAYGNVVNGAGESSWRKQWSGRTSFVESALTKPLHWHKPRKIFVCSMGDLFHESVPFEWIDKIFGTMIHCNARRRALDEDPHIFKLLTKRSRKMLDYCSSQPWLRVAKFCEEKWGWLWGAGKLWYPEHVHLGVTVENQDNVGRIADLIRTPTAKRFVSFEPLLEGFGCRIQWLRNIDYVFIGCESGPKARLCSLAQIQYMMYQCRDAGVKIHIKQIPLDGKCNKHIDEWPKEFRVREV